MSIDINILAFKITHKCRDTTATFDITKHTQVEHDDHITDTLTAHCFNMGFGSQASDFL